MQSSVLCRQNCRNSHLPFPFLVHSIHLPPCHCRLQHLLRACALTLLVITCCNYLHVYIYVCVFFASSPHPPPCLPSFLSVSLAVTLQISWRLQVRCAHVISPISTPSGLLARIMFFYQVFVCIWLCIWSDSALHASTNSLATVNGAAGVGLCQMLTLNLISEMYGFLELVETFFLFCEETAHSGSVLSMHRNNM